jgi:gas vesicle protein
MPDVANETWKGVGSGAVTGAMVGSEVYPGIGTAIGAIIGAAAGGFLANNQANKTNEALKRVEGIPATDPMQLEFLDELRREKRMVETGMTPEFNVAKDLIQQSAAGAMNVATRFNNPATSLYFLKTISEGAGRNINQLMGTIGTQRGQYMTALGSYINDISQRKLDVEMYKTTQNLAVETQKQADIKANQNMMIMYGLSELSGKNNEGSTLLDLFKWYNNRSIPTSKVNSIGTPLINTSVSPGIGTTLRPM